MLQTNAVRQSRVGDGLYVVAPPGLAVWPPSAQEDRVLYGLWADSVWAHSTHGIPAVEKHLRKKRLGCQKLAEAKEGELGPHVICLPVQFYEPPPAFGEELSTRLMGVADVLESQGAARKKREEVVSLMTELENGTGLVEVACSLERVASEVADEILEALLANKVNVHTGHGPVGQNFLLEGLEPGLAALLPGARDAAGACAPAGHRAAPPG